jgi:uncharacterized protein YjiS (DUF1127 family)
MEIPGRGGNHEHHGFRRNSVQHISFAELERVKRLLVEWHERAHSRHELMMLSDRELSDVGLAPADVHDEVRKSFWQ